MIQKLTVLSGLVLSATCMVLHQPQIPLLLGVQYNDPNYEFAYQVNDVHTGDIKSQHESKRGDTVLGQYSLLQPDGIRRTVDYRADDHDGFQASVNNDGRSSETSRHSGVNVQTVSGLGTDSYSQWPAPTATASTLTYQPTSNYQASTYQQPQSYQPAPTYQPATSYQTSTTYQQAASHQSTPSNQPTSYQSASSYQSAPTYQPTPAFQPAQAHQPTANYQPASQTPVAISRTSFVQTISHSAPVSHNTWP